MDRVLVDVGVGNQGALAIERREYRLADRDPFDRPLVVPDADLVPPDERLPKEQQDPSEEILEDVLKRKSDRHREKTETGEKSTGLTDGNVTARASSTPTVVITQPLNFDITVAKLGV